MKLNVKDLVLSSGLETFMVLDMTNGATYSFFNPQDKTVELRVPHNMSFATRTTWLNLNTQVSNGIFKLFKEVTKV